MEHPSLFHCLSLAFLHRCCRLGLPYGYTRGHLGLKFKFLTNPSERKGVSPCNSASGPPGRILTVFQMGF